MVKETVKKEEQEEIVKKETAEKAEYFYGLGKRKTSIAQVRIYPAGKSKEIMVNDKKLADYFQVGRLINLVKEPFLSAGEGQDFHAVVKVAGGGVSSQAEAVRLGVSRALIKFDEALRKTLKAKGFLTRDARIVERKKAGLRKARRSPQWAKR